MKKLVVIAAGVFAALVASLTVISQAGAAPDLTGETYAEAKAAAAQAGYSAVVSTSIGAQVSQDDCIVVRQETTTAYPFTGQDWPGGGGGGRQMRLSLNCTKQPK